MRQRENKISIHLNDRELTKLNRMVSKSRLNREQFIRARLEGFSIREAPPAPLWETVCLLRRAAGNMNTIASHSMFKQVSDIELLRTTVEDIRLCLDQLVEQCMPVFKEVKFNEKRND